LAPGHFDTAEQDEIAGQCLGCDLAACLRASSGQERYGLSDPRPALASVNARLKQ
jgi:hypothetical protein